MSTFMFTASGKKMFPLEPTVEMIDVFDIASHLSKQARWTGATKDPDRALSVAQHAVYCAREVWKVTRDVDVVLEALHHDSSEAILVDVARPLKRREGFREFYLEAEEKLTKVIYERFGIPYTGQMHPAVREADDRMLMTEFRDLMTQPDLGNEELLEAGIDLSRAYEWAVDDIWGAREARDTFLAVHEHLINKRDNKEEQVG